VNLEPYLAQANKLMLARHAPHPYAAALFIDWALSEDGQSMITTFGRVVARKGVKQRFPELVEKESFLVDVDFIGPVLDQRQGIQPDLSRPLTESHARHLD